MDCKQRIIDLLTPNLQAVPTQEHDGSDFFVHVTVGDSPPIVTIRVDNTPDMVAFLHSADSKEIAFDWTDDYIENKTSNQDQQEDVVYTADLELVAYKMAWRIDDGKIATMWLIETL